MHMHMHVRTRAAAGLPARVLALAALALAAAGAARAQNLTDPFGCDVSQGEAYCPGLDACQKPWLDNATALPEGEAANPEPCPGPYHYAQGFVDAAGPPSPDWDAADAEEGSAMLTAMPDIARANNNMGLADSRGSDNVQGRGFQGGFNPFRPGPSAWPGGCTPYCTSTGCRPPPGCGGGGGRPPWAGGGGGGGGGWTPPDLGLGNCARNGAQAGTNIGQAACAEIARQCGPTLRFQAGLGGSNDVVLQMICNSVDTSACVGAYKAYLESASCPYSNTPCGQKIAGRYYRFCRV